MKLFAKISLVFIFCALATASAFANVNYIDISAITQDKELTAQFQNIKDNLPFYANWTYKWEYDVPKSTVSAQLKEFYKNFSELAKKDKNNGELFLLLGDIASYLYNLDAGDKNTDYTKIAADNYGQAIKFLPKEDYRGYWFLGVHYAGIPGGYQIKSVDNFEQAVYVSGGIALPENFWEDYSYISALTAMPSHYFYAMDKAPGIKPLYAKDKLIKSLDKNAQYEKKDLWNVVEKDSNTFFISRPLGMSFYVTKEESSKYGLNIGDYKNNKAGLMIIPPNLKSKEGQSIDYSITILVNASPDNKYKSLREFVGSDKYLQSFTGKKEIKLFDKDKYDKMVTYEWMDNNASDYKAAYGDFGGTHFYIVVIERDKPKYPGLLLEMPTPIPAGKTSAYVLKAQPDRFDGKIFYTILLNTAEDIHEDGLKVFKDFFENRLVIE